MNRFGRCGLVFLGLVLGLGVGSALAQLTPPMQEYVLRSSLFNVWTVPQNQNLVLHDPFTIEAWIRPTSAHYWGRIVSNSFPDGSAYDNKISLDYMAGSINFWQWRNEYHHDFGASLTKPLGEWVHVAVTMNAGELVMYFDGAEVARQYTPLDPTWNCPFWSINGMACCGGDSGFIGNTAQISLWSRALSQAEIQDTASHYLTGQETGLLAYWPCDDGPGDVLRGLGPHGQTLTRPANTRGSNNDGWINSNMRWARTATINDGPFFTTERKHMANNTPRYSSGTLIDFDSDGDLDVVVGYQRNLNLPLVAYRNDGAGGFTEATSAVLIQNIVPVETFEMFPADFNGDGHEDLLVTDQGPLSDPKGRTILFIQSPDGRLVDETVARLPWANAAAIGDIDGDGDIDIFQGTTSSNGDCAINASVFYLNDGQGTFAAVTDRLPGGYEMPGVIQCGRLVDVDRDGDLDLVAGLNGTDRDAVLLNGGTGFFSAAAPTTMPARYGGSAYWTQYVSAADFNGDGWPDLIMGPRNSPESRLQLLINNGDGTFTDASDGISMTYPSPADEQFLTRFIVPGDFNADGWMDFIAVFYAGAEDTQADMFLNLGDGTFERSCDLVSDSPNSPFEQPDMMWGLKYLWASAGDVDDDADVDIALFGAGQSFYISRNIKPWATGSPLPYPTAPVLTAPADGGVVTGVTQVLLDWAGVVTAGFYRIQVATDPAFGTCLIDKADFNPSSYLLKGLTEGTTYYWRVMAVNTRGEGPWSQAFSFTAGDKYQLAINKINALKAAVLASGIDKGVMNSLVKKLENAADKVAMKNITPAINEMGSFKNEVSAQKGKKIPAGTATAWLAAADEILGILNALPK